MDKERYQTQVTEKVIPLVSSTYVRWHMAHRRELLEAWEFPHTQRHGVTLVARADAVPCIQRIFASGCRFYGYDSFTVFPNGKIQPHMDWSPAGTVARPHDWTHSLLIYNPIQQASHTMSLCSRVPPNNVFKPMPLRGPA